MLSVQPPIVLFCCVCFATTGGACCLAYDGGGLLKQTPLAAVQRQTRTMICQNKISRDFNYNVFTFTFYVV